jgi:ABC-2 type transport system ATP-binding protein
MEVVRINSLTKRFSDNFSIDNVNLSIPEGGIFGIVGTNGAGKTTMLKCITGIIPFDSGSIYVFEKSVTDMGSSINRGIGVVYENSDNLFSYLSGQEQLEFAGEIYGLERKTMLKKINNLLEYFNMSEFRHNLIDEYSKGMKKKIAIASVLLQNPDLIILDEPFEGLDSITLFKLKKLIGLLKTRGKTIIIISHFLAYIEELCEEVIIMNKGKIIYQSKTDDISNRIKNEMSKETYLSLEEIFIDLTEDENEQRNLENILWCLESKPQPI